MTLNPQALQPGQEEYEYFTLCHIRRNKKEYCQYDYRATDGDLFSCVRPTLEQAREACAKWLVSK